MRMTQKVCFVLALVFLAVDCDADTLHYGVSDTFLFPAGSTLRYSFEIWNFPLLPQLPDGVEFRFYGLFPQLQPLSEFAFEGFLESADGSVSVALGELHATQSFASQGGVDVPISWVSGDSYTIPAVIWSSTQVGQISAVLVVRNTGEDFVVGPAFPGAQTTVVSASGLQGNGERLWAGTVPVDIEVTPVPEPATLLLLGSGLIGLAGYGRRRFFKK